MADQDYEVTWTEDHFAEVTAANETEAFSKAADYAQEHDTRVDEDDYECKPVDDKRIIERAAQITRNALSMKRCVTISIRAGTAIIEDRLIHPVESHSRMHKTVMEAEMLDELIQQLGYVKLEEVK